MSLLRGILPPNDVAKSHRDVSKCTATIGAHFQSYFYSDLCSFFVHSSTLNNGLMVSEDFGQNGQNTYLRRVGGYFD